MAQILDPIPPTSANSILCCYVNTTNQIQVARITNVPNWYFERVVFPGQRLVFETLAEAQLEIHTGMMASAILSDTLPCTRLQVRDPDAPQPKPASQAQPEAIEKNKSIPVTSASRSVKRTLVGVGA